MVISGTVAADTDIHFNGTTQNNDDTAIGYLQARFTELVLFEQCTFEQPPAAPSRSRKQRSSAS